MKEKSGDVKAEHKIVDFDSDLYKSGYDIGVFESINEAYDMVLGKVEEVVDKAYRFEYDYTNFKVYGLRGILDKLYEEIRRQSYNAGYDDGYVDRCNNSKEIKD